MRSPLLSLLLMVVLPASACSTPEALSQSWQLDRLRLLAIQAEPAEPRPGDTVTFSSLVYTPEGTEVEGAIWFGCLFEDSDSFGCELDPTVMEELEDADFDNMSAEELAELYEQAQEAGLIGFEPLVPPTWVAPTEALDGLEGDERLEGRSAVVNVTVIPVGAEDDADLEVVYKRVPVSEANTPNHNPTITGFLVNGEEVALGGSFSGPVGSSFSIEPLLSEDSIEDYEFINSSGTLEERTEEPFFNWYTEDGSFYQEYTLFPYSTAEWTSDSADAVALKVVMRDRRGGMSWGELSFEAE